MNEKEDTLHFYCTKSLHTKELAKLRSGQDQRKMAEQSQAFLCIEGRDYRRHPRSKSDLLHRMTDTYRDRQHLPRSRKRDVYYRIHHGCNKESPGP